MFKLKLLCIITLGFLVADGWAQCEARGASIISAPRLRPMDTTGNIAVNSQTYSINERGAQTFDTTGAHRL